MPALDGSGRVIPANDRVKIATGTFASMVWAERTAERKRHELERELTRLKPGELAAYFQATEEFLERIEGLGPP